MQIIDDNGRTSFGIEMNSENWKQGQFSFSVKNDGSDIEILCDGGYTKHVFKSDLETLIFMRDTLNNVIDSL